MKKKHCDAIFTSKKVDSPRKYDKSPTRIGQWRHDVGGLWANPLLRGGPYPAMERVAVILITYLFIDIFTIFFSKL